MNFSNFTHLLRQHFFEINFSLNSEELFSNFSFKYENKSLIIECNSDIVFNEHIFFQGEPSINIEDSAFYVYFDNLFIQFKIESEGVVFDIFSQIEESDSLHSFYLFEEDLFEENIFEED